MTTLVPVQLSDFASEVRGGFGLRQKKISPRFFYDDLGSILFEAITLLPEYGLTRADERLLRTYSGEIASTCGPLSVVAELGSGSGKKTIHLLRSALTYNPELTYCPIDISQGALTACQREMDSFCRVTPICGDWMEGLATVARRRSGAQPMLLLFLGSSVGNLDRDALPEFFQDVRRHLRSGDLFLLGADLVKDQETMLSAYDDPTGVTAAFNLNVLSRMNRELGADFDLRSFRHEARWHNGGRRIEMHLASRTDQVVHVQALDRTYSFAQGETIWTESSHKFLPSELAVLGRNAGFIPVMEWIDEQWPLAEVLWRAA